MATVLQTSDPASRGTRIKGFVALTKPRIIELLLVETVPAMIVAKRGWPGLWLIIATVIGGTLAAGGANAVNMYVDRDIDAIMDRTKGRPLVTGVVQPTEALVFALALEAIAFVFLRYFVNLISAVLAVSAMLFYVFVYTLWLKRRSTSNIVIGGAAGAVCVLCVLAPAEDACTIKVSSHGVAAPVPPGLHYARYSGAASRGVGLSRPRWRACRRAR